MFQRYLLFDQVCKWFYVLCCRWSDPRPRQTLGQVSQIGITINKQRVSFRVQYVFPAFPLYFADRASQYIYLNINQIDALNFYKEFISRLYMFQAQVLIVRRPKLYYTASGIITPIGGRPVHRLREDWITCAPDGHLQVWWYQRLYSTIFASWRWKHVLDTCRGVK